MYGKRVEHELRDGIEGKVCSACHEWKPLTGYGAQRCMSDKLSSSCRECKANRDAVYRANHVEQLRQMKAQYYQKHQDEIKVRVAAYAKAHRAEANAAFLRYYYRNHEERLEMGRKWHAANREKVAERHKRYYAEHPDRFLAAGRRYRQAHPQEAHERQRAWKRKNKALNVAASAKYRAHVEGAAGADYTTVQHIAQRWAMFGNRCWMCGAPATATDHVKPISKGGAHWPCNLRPICRSCNSAKHDRWPFPVIRERESRMNGKLP